MTVVSRYSKYRRWAMDIAGDDDEARIVALVALFDASREYEPRAGAPLFRAFARERIEAALEAYAWHESSA